MARKEEEEEENSVNESRERGRHLPCLVNRISVARRDTSRREMTNELVTVLHSIFTFSAIVYGVVSCFVDKAHKVLSFAPAAATKIERKKDRHQRPQAV